MADYNLTYTGVQVQDKLDTVSVLQSETTQLDWQTATVDDREIQVSKPTTLKSVKFQLESDIVAGTVISISTDGGVSSLPLKDIDGVDILELEKGFYEVIADATFFTLRPSGGSNIKSKQIINVAYNNKTTLNIPISTVDKDSSVIRIQQKNSELYIAESTFNAEFVDSSNIVLTTYKAVSNDIILEIEIIEFNNVKSKQSGIAIIPDLSNELNLTIAEVDTLKTLIFSTTRTNAEFSRNHALAMSILKLTTSTNLNLSIFTTSYEKRFSYEILELK